MHRFLLPVGVLPALLLGLGACGGDAQRDDAGQVKERSDVSGSSVNVGDCIAGAARGEVESLTAVPCDAPHGAEAYHAFDLQDGGYPGDEPVATSAEQGCIAAFADFVGISYEASVLEISSTAPSAERWADGRRQVLCFVKDPDGPTTGSLANADR